jgi:hypothetical protein
VHNRRKVPPPPYLFEYAYYLLIAYAILGVAWGLHLPLFGAGTLALLAMLCVIRLGSRAIDVYAPVIFPLGCAISFIVLQLVLYNESLMSGDTRPFVPWLLKLIVVQSLCLRQGFLHRFALVTFVIGLFLLPYMHNMVHTDNIVRVGLKEVGLTNANALAMWFGFCSVYFIITGIETKRNMVRVASWLIAVGCLYIVGLTVSRGPLLGVAITTTFALRRLLKRSFVPILFLLMLLWIIWAVGLFEEIATFYARRGTEETGRSFLWSSGVERFFSSPLVGMGISNVEIPLPSGYPAAPHNGLRRTTASFTSGWHLGSFHWHSS